MAVVIITGEKKEASSHKKRATKSGWGGDLFVCVPCDKSSTMACDNSYCIISLDKEKENNSDFLEEL